MIDIFYQQIYKLIEVQQHYKPILTNYIVKMNRVHFALQCPCCHSSFNFQNTPKILKNCQHSICLKCLKTQKQCPLDCIQINVVKYGIKSFLTNTQILEHNKFINVSPISQLKSSILLAKVKQNNTFYANQFNFSSEMCLLHLKLADLICINEGKFICRSCSLSDDHKEHKILNYDELLKSISNITDQTFKIYQQLNQKSNKITKKCIDQYIEFKFSQKQKLQEMQIRKHFQRLIQKFRQLERQALKNLDLIFIQNKNKLKQKIKVQDLNENKNQWINKVHKITNVMENLYNFRQIQTALSYLNQNCQQNSIVRQGHQLQIQLSTFENLVQDEILQKIKTLKPIFKEDMYLTIQSFCSLKQIQKIAVQQIQQSKRDTPQNLNIQKFILTTSIDKVNQNLKLKLNQIKHINSSCEKTDQIKIQNDDFLLETYDIQQEQIDNLINNQVTFDQKYSIINGEQAVEKDIIFTPFLLKNNQSLQNCQESTIQNINILYKQAMNSQETFKINDRNTLKTKHNSLVNKQRISVDKKQNRFNLKHKKIDYPCLARPNCQSRNKSDSKCAKPSNYKCNKRSDSKCEKRSDSKCEKQSDSKCEERLDSQCRRRQYSGDQDSINLLQNFPLNLKTETLKRGALNILNEDVSKRMRKIQIPEKYKQMWQDTKNDKLDIVDFTGAQLGDSIILLLAEILTRSQKTKNLKLIRNKITDNTILQFVQALRYTNITSVNLSQNLLTERALQIVSSIDLGNIKVLTFSLNKINARTVKNRIETMKQRGITVSI